MKLIKIIPALAIVSTIAACGEDFEWFPDVEDTFAPSITASVSGKPLFDNRTTLVSLPAMVTFSANEPATVYYTTNGSAPSTASASVNIATANSSAEGPSITITNTVLKFFGIDKSARLNQSNTVTTYIKSP